MSEVEQDSQLPSTGYQLPGFGLPLNFTPGPGDKSSSNSQLHIPPAVRSFRNLVKEYCGPLFRNALECDGQLPLTPVREFTMMQLMNQLTDKPNWDEKIFDETVSARWRLEALGSAPSIDITEKMVDWCIAEPRYKATEFKKTGVITVLDGDVVKSDSAVPTSLKEALRVAAAKLEDVPDFHQDWHPGSNETVLDLVHPSLFPIVYGSTRILNDGVVGLDDCIKRCGEGEVLSIPSVEDAQVFSQRWIAPTTLFPDPYSRKFQWLPCDVALDGNNVKITSYINNLHPVTHKPLYVIIEKIVTLTIPLWNQTLTPLKTPYFRYDRVHYAECEYNPDPDDIPEERRPQQLPNESENDFWERRANWERGVRRVVRPEPGEFRPPTVPDHMHLEHLDENGILKDEHRVDLMKDYAKRGLQVIVKLANIHLTPEKPEYGGGTWHVEGQLNEHICATALYYYDLENITESRLSFRQQCDIDDADGISYQQEHHEWLSEVFGCEQDGPAIQDIGDVTVKEGRLITFPNVFQHRVLPFQLADKSKPGHRKILALFLVDPHMKVISSANVPCQQKAWWAQELLKNGALPNLPTELANIIIDNVDDFPIGLRQAKGLRLELMEERKNFVIRHTETFQSDTFSLCEH